MLKYGNRDFRSLQEQVYANMRNIEDIIKGQDIMADYTLQIVGQVDTAAELPDAETYDGKLGDIYVVGEQSPFHGYAFVKVYENENVPSWVDLGAILVQGPKGDKGDKGDTGETGAQGPQGDQGVPAGFGVPTASIQGGVGTPNVSITASGPNTARVFDFTFYNLKGEKGDPGAGVQDFSTSDAGKSLVVNSTGTATEWDFVGLSPEDQEKLDNSLQLPESAPAAQQLVGINTSGEQNALTVGEGLSIDNGTIKAGEAYLTINFNNSTIVTDEATKAILTAGTYNLVKILNYGGTGRNYEFEKTTISGLTVKSDAAGETPNIGASGSPIYVLKYCGVSVEFNNETSAKSSGDPGIGIYSGAPSGDKYVVLSYAGSAIRVVCSSSTNIGNFVMLPYTSQVLKLAGGTLSSGNYPLLDFKWNGKPRPYNNLTYEVVDSDVDANAHILMRVSRYDFSARTLYIFGQYINDTTGAITASYTGTINCQNGVYTITKHSA